MLKQAIKDYLYGFLIIAAGIITGFAAIELFFRHGPVFIFYFSIPVLILAGIPAALITLIFQIVFKLQRTRILPAILSFAICALLVFHGKGLYDPSPGNLFERFVSKEIVQSVSGVKGVIEYPGIDHVVRISFRISPEDINYIRESGGFKISAAAFPIKTRFIDEYPWWDSAGLKKLLTHERILKKGSSSEFQYLWYNPENSTAWFLSIDT